LFLGHFRSQLKQSNLLSLPEIWRKSISGTVYLTQGFDQNLLILTEGTFREIYLQLTSLNIADPLVRLLSRMFLGKASPMEVDKNGVITLPVNLMEYANLSNEFFIVGQGDYLEVWSPDQWQQQQVQINDIQANTQRFSTLMITTH
jgi:MraZ protein